MCRDREEWENEARKNTWASKELMAGFVACSRRILRGEAFLMGGPFGNLDAELIVTY